MSPVVAIIIFVVLGAGIVAFWLRRMATQGEKSMRARYPEARSIIRGALFYGQESKGVTQMRGNGTLVVTEGEIIFERWLPKAEYRIRIEDITGLETPRGFLGKTSGRMVLRVIYTPVTGDSDSMAWYVNNVEALKRQIEDLRSKIMHKP